MAEFADTPIPYVPIGTQAAAVRSAIDVPQLSAANSFGGFQKLAIPGPFATDAEANTFGVPDDNLYYRSDGTVRAASHISLDLAFALDKTLTARTGPTPTFSRASSGLFVNANGILVGKTAGTTTSITPSTTTIGASVTVTVASGSVVGWLVGQSVSLIVDTDGGNDNDASELWLVGTIVSMTATELVFTVTEKTATAGSATAWTLGYRGARFDHDPATFASKGLLIEESRTNFVTRSEEFDNSIWDAATQRNLIVTANDTASPSGAMDADRLTVGSTTTVYQVIQNIPSPSGTLTIGTTYTVSAFFKPNQVTRVSIWAGNTTTLPVDAMFDLTGSGSVVANAFGTASIQQYPNGWYRCAITGTAGATSSTSLRISPVSGTSRTYPGNSVDSFYAWGAQVEAGAFPTSYIPTTSGTAIRSADVCSIIGDAFASFYNQSEGTLLTDSTPQTVNGTSTVFGVSNGTANERFWNRFAPSEQAVVTSGVVESQLDATNPVAGTRYKIAVGVKLNDLALSLDGAAVVTDTSQPMPTVDRAGIGNPLGVAAGGAMHIARIQYFRKRLSNAKLQTLTAP